jgi:hypothetical protein
MGLLGNVGEAIMKQKPASFNLNTVALLWEVLDDAWASIEPAQKAAMVQALLAERILMAAEQGERDPVRLREAALTDNLGDTHNAAINEPGRNVG